MRESREIRNKRVALDAITLLERIAYFWGNGEAIREAEEFHRRWAAAGVAWTRTTISAFDLETWLPATEMAELADVTATTVRSWHYRGHITRFFCPERGHVYNVGEVVRYQAGRDIKR